MSSPPPKGTFWRAFAAITVLPVNGTQKAVLGCLVDHANPKSGLCYPSEALIAAEIGRPLRAIERAVADLLKTRYVSRKRRTCSSNLYEINFDAILNEWDAYKARGTNHRHASNVVIQPVTQTVTEQPPKTERRPSKVAGQPVSSGGSTPSKTAAKQEKIKVKEEKKKRTSPHSGDGASASLYPPAGEVGNLGDELARFERAFKRDPSKLHDLHSWHSWLEDQGVQVAFDLSDRNAQRAKRLAEEVYYFLDEAN